MPQISREILKRLILSESGASAVGVARVAEVCEHDRNLFKRWIADGCHADMSYLERYAEVRDNPELLLPGAKSIIMAAFSFANPDAVAEMKAAGQPLIAEYALGKDYHNEVRARLMKAATKLAENYGGEWRVCVDTAPLRERYWARRAGVGFIGKNNYLIIPGLGAHFVLGALLWTGRVDDGYDTPCALQCDDCQKCVRACPGAALSSDGQLDARRCLSYLTIESRDPIPSDINTCKSVFGCDICRCVCPHEPHQPPQTNIPAFVAHQEITALTRENWLNMTPSHFKKLFRDSPLRRTRLDKIKSILSGQ